MVLIAQISDLHLVPRNTLFGGLVDTNACAARAVDAVNRLRARPDAVVVTGDVIETCDEREYAIAREILERLEMPFYPLPGNHDASVAMKRAFGGYAFAAAGPPDRLYYAVDIGAVRLVVLDSSVPGAGHGELSAGQLAFLDSELSAASARPAVVALHHHPVPIGHPMMDTIALRNAAELAAVVARHKNVVRVLCGHCHRAVTSAFAGTVLYIAPGTAHQLEHALDGDDPSGFNLEPPGFLLHRWNETDGMTTHLLHVERYPGPYPFP